MKLTGKAYWARVQEGNFDEFGGREFYKITVALDDASWVKFNKSGLGLQPKAVSKDDPDIIGVTFRRDVEPKTGKDKRGKTWSIGGGAPKVTLDGEEFDGLIGNGSEVEVVVETYDTKIKKKGHRLEKVNIIDLVKYEAPDDDDDDDDEPPVRKTPAKKHVVEEDDEPPFDTDEDEAPKKTKKKLAF
jgi:hypothetical protein